MRNLFLIIFVSSSIICFSNEEEKASTVTGSYCDDAMFDAMDWAAEAGLDQQQIADAGNGAYAECWLMNRNLIRDGGQGVE
ncbi:MULTISPECIES: hypothetical protein [Flavobacterium]|uniref:Uncharacterized protein n=1 Tax=Flavobacterium jumunjinense TaxID=998845 RepID=A0ABV5GL33_9FLAO|nr:MULTISPECIES: hypothetical protein [Flavobacterium]